MQRWDGARWPQREPSRKSFVYGRRPVWLAEGDDGDSTRKSHMCNRSTLGVGKLLRFRRASSADETGPLKRREEVVSKLDGRLKGKGLKC